MDFKEIPLAKVDDIPEGKGIVVLLPEGKEVALFKVKGQIYALNNECPHKGAPLGEGELEGCMVSCPWHGWLFDVRNGACENMPGEDAESIAISVKNGDVFLA